MFKVGDRVWSIKHNDFKTIKTEMEADGLYNFTDNEWAYKQHIHQTADDMFKELGFEKKLEDSSFIIYSTTIIEVYAQTELRIDKINKCYKLTNYTKNNNLFSANANVQLHKAIHQKLIELGWIE